MINNVLHWAKNQSDDERLAYTVISPIVLLTFQYVFLVIFKVSTINTELVSLVTKAVTGIIFLCALPIVLRRNVRMLISVYTIFIIVFIAQYLFYPQNRIYLVSLIFPFFFIGLPMFLYTISVRDYHTFYHSLVKAANVVFIVSTIFGVLLLLQIIKLKKYSMPYSYYMLFPLLIDSERYLSSKSKMRLARTLISFMLILFFGARGPILCFMIFIALKTIVHWRWLLVRKNAIIAAVIVAVISLLFIYRVYYVQSIIDALAFFNIRSRSLILFLRDGIYLTNRDEIYNVLWEGFSRNFIFGSGIAGDRYLLGGSYSHNIVVELMVSFGVIIGGLLIFALFRRIIEAYQIRDKNYRNLLDFAFAFGFVHLWISSSIFEDFRFWMFLGILMISLNLEQRLSSFYIFRLIDPWISKVLGKFEELRIRVLLVISGLAKNRGGSKE